MPYLNKKGPTMKQPFRSTIEIFFLILLILFASNGRTLAQDHAAEIDKFIGLYHQYGRFNGSVLVAENGQVIYKKGFGLANMEWGQPNGPDTKFLIGSLTKQFTAMLIMQLVEEGRIDLEGMITDYLPDYRPDTGRQVTVHHLLTHTSGIPNYTALPGFWTDTIHQSMTRERFVETMCSGDLEFEPGATFRYCNTGYYLLGLIVEQLTGREFEDVLWEKILDPAGMEDSGLYRPEVILKKRASGYYRNLDWYVNADFVAQPDFYVFSAGGMYSTVEDLYRWDQALYTEQLLSEKYKKIMFTPYLNNYACGWGVRKIPLGATGDSTTTITHTGDAPGFNARIVRLVDDRHLIVLMHNTGHTDLHGISRGIANILYDLPYDRPKQSIARTLLQTIMEQDAASAVEQYHRLEKEQPDGYDFSEGELNVLGYQLLESGKNAEALEIFRLNAEAFPESWNVHDSLGEAYLVNGDRKKAVACHQRSLELNPDQQQTGLARMLSETAD
jgi:CubicO group peptidase (beta-lactamase class C family)